VRAVSKRLEIGSAIIQIRMVLEFLIIQRENRGRPRTIRERFQDSSDAFQLSSLSGQARERERGEKSKRRESCSLSLRHATANLRESRRRTLESIEIVYTSALGEKYERAYYIFTITKQEVTRVMPA